MAFVYLLRCADGSLYCGWTVDLERRLAAHAAGRGARYTRSRTPVELAAAWQTPDRRTARSLEARIKRLKRGYKEALIAGAPLPAATPAVSGRPAGVPSECTSSGRPAGAPSARATTGSSSRTVTGGPAGTAAAAALAQPASSRAAKSVSPGASKSSVERVPAQTCGIRPPTSTATSDSGARREPRGSAERATAYSTTGRRSAS
jgi:putative endonuclease